MELPCDVVVVGAGNAAICAALAAREEGANVIVLERAPESERGGNTAFVGGACRVAHNGLDELEPLVGELPADQRAKTVIKPYTRSDFFDDMARVTEYRGNADLIDIMVNDSLGAFRWLKENHGVRFSLMYGRQAFEVDGKFTFYGGLALEAWGGGSEYSRSLFVAAEKAGIDVRYSSRAVGLIRDGDGVAGVTVSSGGRRYDIRAGAVVLACGGFEANPEWRAKYLGPGWEMAAVRGSRFNTGDGLRLALEFDAMPAGQWSRAHAVGQDLNAPPVGDRDVADEFQKHSYPYGIMVNADGERFLDEGADFRNFTYAKYGPRIMDQPGHFAWQVFDQKAIKYLRNEYFIKQVTRVRADTLEQLAGKLEGVDPEGFLATVREYNAAVQTDVAFNPTELDGRGTTGLKIKKSNWALTIEDGPFEAYAVGVGITFSFGGVRITDDAQVVNTEDVSIPGLFAAGEMVGGIFYFNYPAGTGLASGAVFGRRAGASAAKAALAART